MRMMTREDRIAMAHMLLITAAVCLVILGVAGLFR